MQRVRSLSVNAHKLCCSSAARVESAMRSMVRTIVGYRTNDCHWFVTSLRFHRLNAGVTSGHCIVSDGARTKAGPCEHELAGACCFGLRGRWPGHLHTDPVDAASVMVPATRLDSREDRQHLRRPRGDPVAIAPHRLRRERNSRRARQRDSGEGRHFTFPFETTVGLPRSDFSAAAARGRAQTEPRVAGTSRRRLIVKKRRREASSQAFLVGAERRRQPNSLGLTKTWLSWH